MTSARSSARRRKHRPAPSGDFGEIFRVFLGSASRRLAARSRISAIFALSSSSGAAGSPNKASRISSRFRNSCRGRRRARRALASVSCAAGFRAALRPGPASPCRPQSSWCSSPMEREASPTARSAPGSCTASSSSRWRSWRKPSWEWRGPCARPHTRLDRDRRAGRDARRALVDRPACRDRRRRLRGTSDVQTLRSKP